MAMMGQMRVCLLCCIIYALLHYTQGQCPGICEQLCNLDGTGQPVCSCSQGFELQPDMFSCEDIDECATGTSGCSQGCTNSVPGFECFCFPGYQILSPALPFLCVDIDECATNNGGCEDTCVNNDGSFTCECGEGFELAPDGLTCDDIDECATANGGCDQICNNNEGSFSCDCNPGYELQPDGFSCQAAGTGLCLQYNPPLCERKR